jgi:PAS domain S-box-containing protein
MAESLRLFLIAEKEDRALLLGKTLEEAGHQVTPCRLGVDALTVLGHATYDLVLLSPDLTDFPGVDFLHALHREHIRVPTLVVAVPDKGNLAREAFQAGALDFIVQDADSHFLQDLPKRIEESATRYRLWDMNRLLIAGLESAGDGITITDLQGTILHVNRALEEMSGYSRQELIGQNPRLFKSGHHPPEFYARLWQTVLARNVWQGELINRRRDGRLVEVSLTVSPILDAQGQLTHLVGIERDMSQRKKLERQLVQAQKVQSVGTLAKGVAHEFNNLLAGISGFLFLTLQEPDLPERARDFLRKGIGLVERSAGLTRQLLTYARKPTLSPRPTAMGPLLAGTVELVNRTLGLQVDLNIPDQGEGVGLLKVIADPDQLQQALVNLALNARDALEGPNGSHTGRLGRVPSFPKGEGPTSSKTQAILFRLRHQQLATPLAAFPQAVPPGDYVVVEVVDRGCGMSAEVLNQALDPFFTTKEVGQGTGLGLPAALGIIQGHQGFLTLESTLGQGTNVALYLPRLVEKPTEGEEPGSSLLNGEVIEPESAPRRAILVVDDEPIVLEVVGQFLELAGHQVHCVTSGQEGKDFLAQGRQVDLVILDMEIPGEESAHNLHGLHQVCPQLPVLLCSGLQPAERTVPAEASGIVYKPFRMNELWYSVQQALALAGNQIFIKSSGLPNE